MKIYTLSFFILFIGIVYSQKPDTTSRPHHHITITSDPDGANVVIDDSSFGKTPLRLSSFPKSSFSLRLYDEKKNPWGYNVKLDNDEDFVVHALINKDYGLLQTYSDPPGADVFLNDSLVGITPLGPTKIHFSYTKVKIVKEGYFTFEKTIYMRPNFSYLYNLNAKLQNAVATIDFKELAKYPSVYIDDKKVDANSVNLKIISGIHILHIKGSDNAALFDEDFSPEGGSTYLPVVLYNQMDYQPILLSVVLPGLGQVSKSSYLEGACIMTAMAGAVAATIISSKNYEVKNNNYNSQRIRYISSTSQVTAVQNRAFMDAAKSDLDKALLPKQLSIGMLIGVYLYNIFDIVCFHSSRDILDFKNISHGTNVSGNFNFSPSDISISTRYNF
jgi:hypothetical protein